MLKKSHYTNKYLPYLLVGPQLLITLVFFFWPAGEAVYQAFLLSDPFGAFTKFVWFENFQVLFATPEYRESFSRTFVFSISTALLSLVSGLFLATLVNRITRFKFATRSVFIWPYAVAPAMAGVLCLFIFHSSYGAVGHLMSELFGWNPTLNGTHAMILVIVAAAWKQIAYNFVFFLGGLQAVPKSLIEAACIDGAGPFTRFFRIVLPLLSPTLFFLLVMNFIYAFFDTFGIIHTTTHGGPGGATNILVYKVYSDGFIGLDLGSSAAQSVILMIFALLLTFVQFRYIEKKVQYG